MELSKQGSLYRKLKIEKKFSETSTGRYMLNVLSAMHFLHQQDPPILHRDLKPENLLMFDNGVVKITDFGWSAEQSEVRNTFCGTQEYLAPEMIEGSGHDEKLDVWTLGILVYELIHGKTPFFNIGKGVDVRAQRKLIEKSILTGKFEMRPDLAKATKDVIRAMLQPKKERRPTTRQLLDAEFFKKAANPMTRSKSRKALQSQENISMKEVFQLRLKIAELKKQNNDLTANVKRLESQSKGGSTNELLKRVEKLEKELLSYQEIKNQLKSEKQELLQDVEFSKREERTLLNKVKKHELSLAKLEKTIQQMKQVNKFIFSKSKVILIRNLLR